MISAAVQRAPTPTAPSGCKALFEKLQKNECGQEPGRLRQVPPAHGRIRPEHCRRQGRLGQNPGATWLKTLEQYVADYPTTPDTAEAMLQLAIGQEFAGQEDEAKKWYARIVDEFPDSPAAQKAAGARRRLESVGKSLTFRGQSPTAESIDLAEIPRQGGAGPVLGHLVASRPRPTWPRSRSCWNKYGRSFAVVGVSLDSDART